MAHDLSFSENEDILTEHETDQAIEADDDAFYEPDTDSQVVAVEPPIISIGRGRRKRELRRMQTEQGDR